MKKSFIGAKTWFLKFGFSYSTLIVVNAALKLSCINNEYQMVFTTSNDGLFVREDFCND